MADTDYAEIAELKERVNFPLEDDSQDPRFKLLLNTSARTVDHLTRGYIKGCEAFGATADNVVRLFDDDGSGVVLIDDALVITQVKRGGVIISADDYKLSPYNELPYTRLIFSSNTSRRYSSLYENAGLGEIEITGTWGYCTSEDRPPEIKEATLIQAERLYERIGVSPQELMLAMRNPYRTIDPLVSALLAEHKRPPGL
ncbi:MAG TPA: hypothetical protein VF914_21005 [Chloroflexia bacterium]|jgi:hypothetical protein